MKVEMNRQDLLELYQLVVMYTRCYDSELGEDNFMDSVKRKIQEQYRRRGHPQFPQPEMCRAEKSICRKYRQDDPGTAQ